MEADTRNLQNDFFNAARKENATVTVFLGNGKKLIGRLKSFDKFTLLLDGPQGEQIIFKHAISTVSATARPVDSAEDATRGRAASSGNRAPVETERQ